MQFEEDILYELYDDEQDGEVFNVGYFLAQDEDFSLFQSINLNGFDSGLFLCRTESIYRTQFNTKYCQAIQKLMEYHKTKLKNYSFKTDDLCEELLLLAKAEKAIIDIELESTGAVEAIGFVESVNDKCVTTLEIDQQGFEDGNTIVKLNDIRNITFNSYKRMKHKILYELNTK